MKNIFFALFLLLHSLYGFSQFKNTKWKVGVHAAIDFSSGTGVPSITDSCSSEMNFTNTSICDRNGDIIFYSNACRVYNKNGHVMPNGSGFNQGTISNTYVNTDYYPLIKAATIIPFPNDTNKFYMFYENMEWNVDGDYLPEKLYYLVVDRTLDGGKGDVTIKDQIVINGDTLIGDEILAVKHGNGKDWWLIARKYKSNLYYKVLIDGNGVHSAAKQTIGNNFNYQYTVGGGGGISLQGDKLCYLNADQSYRPFQMNLFDFDRCTGLLSNYKTIFHSNITDTISWWSSCFSPNGKYLYFSDKLKIYQMDLNATNLLSSVQVVGLNTIQLRYFFKMEIGPDNKIYVAPYGSNNYMSRINAPDSFGMACHFVENAIQFGSSIAGPWAEGGLPNTPNFALGAINCNVGMENVATENNGLNIYPNPTNSNFTIASDNSTIKSITIYDIVGREVMHQSLNKKSALISLAGYSSGLYFIKVVNENGEVFTKKIVKE